MRVKWSEIDRDLAGTEAAMLRAARAARDLARRYGQPLAIMRNGKVTLVSADDLPELDLPVTAPAGSLHSNLTATDIKFCSECGRPIHAAKIECASCHAKLDSSAKFCPECGRKVAAI